MTKSKSRREAEHALSRTLASQRLRILAFDEEFPDDQTNLPELSLFRPLSHLNRLSNNDSNIGVAPIEEQETEYLKPKLEERTSGRIQRETSEKKEKDKEKEKEKEKEAIQKKKRMVDSSEEEVEESTTLTHLKQLIPLLKKLFKEEITHGVEFKLGENEQKILAAIIARKFEEKLKLTNDPYELKEEVDSIMKLEGKKRPEENYKFAFKRVIKAMREEFKNNLDSKSRSRKKNTEKAFYEYYFKTIAEKKKVSIERFYHPRNSSTRNPNLPKTINSEYIKSISESQEFIACFRRHLASLVEDSKRLIDSKINGLGSQFEKQTEELGDEATNKIVEYITKNKKCKLPWTSKEVREATVAVGKLI